MMKWLWLGALLGCGAVDAVRAEVRLNEIAADNRSGLADEDGLIGDWIELYNPGGQAADLTGWGLSDRADDRFRWTFPAGSVIEAGGFLVVHATGKDRRVTAGGFSPEWQHAYPEAAGLWLFDSAAAGVIDSSANGNHGTLAGGTLLDLGTVRAYQFDRFAEGRITVPNSPSLQTTGSMTLSLWLRPASFDRSQNPWDKAYGGEGTISLLTTGRLAFLWGTAGAAASPFQGFSTASAIPLNEWTHVVMVRDLAVGELRWYLNGVVNVTGKAAYPAAVASSAALKIGGGYAGTFDGMIAMPLLLPRALSAAEVGQLHAATAGAFRLRPHTDFSISRLGESILLTRPDGSAADSAPALAMRGDHAYGRQPDGSGPWRVFSAPTPGAANTGHGYLGILEPPEFSVKGGFHETAFALELQAAEGAEIHYTLDGSEPRESRIGGEAYSYKTSYPRYPGDPIGASYSGTMTTAVYAGPLAISDRSSEPNRLSDIATWFATAAQAPAGNLRKATVVRARAVKEGYLPSDTVGHSYFVGPEVATRFDLPVLSITTDDANLFDYEKGIYVPGKIADDWRLGAPNSNPPALWMIPANYWQTGDEWERPLHLEYFSPTGERGFAKNLGARIHGGASRTTYRKSMRLYARAGYEPGPVEFPIFQGLERKAFPGEVLASFDRLILRNGGNDATGILFLDALLQSLVEHLPLGTQAWQPALHYLNGESWGLINLRERQDEYFIRDHYGVQPEDSVIISNNGDRDHAMTTDRDAYLRLVDYAAANDMALPQHWNYIRDRVDVDNHALYHAYEVYIANLDWPHNNTRNWRKRTPALVPDAPDGHDGRWRWMAFDTELGFQPGYASHNSLARIANPAPGSVEHTATRMFRGLLANPDYRRLLVNHLADLMNSAFIPARVNAKIDEFNALLAHSRAEHFQRWQSSGTVNGGQGFKDFATARPGHVRQQVIQQFGLAGTAKLTVSRDGGGTVAVNALTIDADTPGVPDPARPYPWTGEYFQGVPARLKAIPEPGFRFSGWTELPGVDSPEIAVDLTGDSSYTAVFEALPRPLVVHAWDHEQAADFLTASFSVGGASVSLLPGPATVVERSTASQSFATAHLRINNPLGCTASWSLPTTGYENVTLEFLTRRSGQGAGQQTLSYTVDGNEWRILATYPVFDAAPEKKSFDFSTIAGVADNPRFAVRMTFSQDAEQLASGTGLAGNQRLDDLIVSGVPRPGTNRPPVVVNPPGRQMVRVGGAAMVMDVGDLVSDPDGDSLVHSVHVEPAGIASAGVEGDRISVQGLATGNGVVTVGSDDGSHAPVTVSFGILVHPPAHRVAGADYYFGEWSPTEPGGRFPPSMVFLQGEGNNDSLLTTELPRAYAIPESDAASPADVGFPYAAASRTRINGLGPGGISFLNTGRGRDLGGAVLALDTRGVADVRLHWVAGTVAPGPRTYALRLQAREGHAGGFKDIFFDGLPIETPGGAVAGQRMVCGPLLLPAECLGREYVQLVWRYYQTGGDAGSRDEISLDEILVTAGATPRSFEAWRVAEYPELELRDDPAVSGPLAANHGVANLLRYALGLGRGGEPAARLPGLTPEGMLRFPVDPAKTDLIYRIQASHDLSDWSQVLYDSATVGAPVPVDGWISLPVGFEGGAQRHFRLQVTR
jgi:hypothetical protein